MAVDVITKPSIDPVTTRDTSLPVTLHNKPKRPSNLPLQTPTVTKDDVILDLSSTHDDSSTCSVILVENNRLSRLKIPGNDTASKDSDSLITDSSYYYETESFDSHSCWWSHPKVRQNWKIVLSAFILLIIGTGLVVTGFLVEIMPIAGFKGIVFFIAGSICFIPGAYHVVYVYCAVKGRRGFQFSNLPLFN